MTEQHPITPPDELVASMIMQTFGPLGPTGLADKEELAKAFASFSAMAAKWGADQELEACCEVLARELICDGKHVATDLRAVRRPKPPSLKEQALAVVENSEICDHLSIEHADILRRALEALDD